MEYVCDKQHLVAKIGLLTNKLQPYKIYQEKRNDVVSHDL